MVTCCILIWRQQGCSEANRRNSKPTKHCLCRSNGPQCSLSTACNVNGEARPCGSCGAEYIHTLQEYLHIVPCKIVYILLLAIAVSASGILVYAHSHQEMDQNGCQHQQICSTARALCVQNSLDYLKNATGSPAQVAGIDGIFTVDTSAEKISKITGTPTCP